MTYYFDHTATTRCCEPAAQRLRQFTSEDFGNPSSSHACGRKAAQAIREARAYLASLFGTEPSQAVFTGSGTESDNLAVYGVALAALARGETRSANPARILISAIEHPAVRKTALSLESLGFDVRLVSVDSNAQIRMDELERLLTPETILLSIQQVNNIVGAVLPVEEIAARAKRRVPGLLFHTDAVQAFGKVAPPVAGSAVDLVSLSAHKIRGPKGVGALLVLDKTLLSDGRLRPVIWGGGQEGGFRSGTQNAGLIAGFHAACVDTLARREESTRHVRALHSRLREGLLSRGLLHSEPAKSLLRWNSPAGALPNIVNLSLMAVAPGKSAEKLPNGVLAQLLEERGCLVSTGSACSSMKSEPDAVLQAMGAPTQACVASVRVSLSGCQKAEEIDTLVAAFADSVAALAALA